MRNYPKSLILILAISICLIIPALSLKVHDHIDEHDYIWVSEDKSQWIGYLPQCEYICTQKE